jgi:phosphatidylglycerol:prolipoprotein diacylglycerol transferase
MYLFWRRGWLGAVGQLTGVFLCGYGIARVFVEFFRQPDAHIGLFGDIFSIGQLLSFPMIIVGFYLLRRSWRQGNHHGKS